MTNVVHEISVAHDFSKEPCGRTRQDGCFSGQEFREKYLAPALLKPGALLVNLDDTDGYSSSFLEEAFGGLVRNQGFCPDDLRKKLRILSLQDPTLIDEIDQYLDEAYKDTAQGILHPEPGKVVGVLRT